MAVEKNLDAFLHWICRVQRPSSGTDRREEASDTLCPSAFPERISSARCGTRGLPLLTRSADVFVFPGSADTFGLVLLEELASGLPVAANPIVRPLDVIEIAALACLTRFSGEPRSQPSQFPASLRVPRALTLSPSASARQFVDNVFAAHSECVRQSRGAALDPIAGIMFN